MFISIFERFIIFNFTSFPTYFTTISSTIIKLVVTIIKKGLIRI